MKVIVHRPKISEDSAELARRVAAIHADAIIKYIQKLPVSQEEKRVLLRNINQNKKDLD